jgi:hydroxyacylglutathione hydrolase
MLIAKDANLRIIKLILGPFKTNTYILVCEKTRESLIIDAPADAKAIIEALKNTEPQTILLTHDHPDHTGGMTKIRTELKIPLATHELSSSRLESSPEFLLKDGDIIKLGNLKIDVIFTPGHTRGSLCFMVDSYLFAGDTLFPGGPGHTDMPEDFEMILSSITHNIFCLSDDSIILPGHGESTTIGQSKREYKLFASKSHKGLYGDVTWVS